MQPEEFRQSIDISDLILPKQGIIVIWKWCWTKDESSNEEHCPIHNQMVNPIRQMRL
jgi:hypothetical protein